MEEGRINMALSEGASTPSKLYQAIPQRQYTRSVYDGQPLSADALSLLWNAAAQEGVSVKLFTDEAERE